ncbi:MAG: hypothetical protein A2750_01215 [Candidatus Yanofskybacteria bacterium RIFCSPHIGHO2_01_FULL_45_42]|uniref:Uncharacterized protein n=2 Tax=Candidatus Yanofskyibacteriota TaxID=1752733 RepID=A0A1F8H3R6_9BACT|nr:MAG: hypothetical protein A2750_01215 [Candidatus Yanofskybacteria bacterium RIFCSPHIGHO2_01_FULL_45_42]OGN26887.1 MAG: hypothetical protein A3B17_01780 [Candidatus Yanofskybacteria bacterium RIFCSPLOWO2_01_FULL_45_72]OGN31606.1 MAG: hypothetical protein A3J01_01045 [Candidatus Yanofskybacteria bacterium RIFCSPLOWO2_02_FULL_45_18]
MYYLIAGVVLVVIVMLLTRRGRKQPEEMAAMPHMEQNMPASSEDVNLPVQANLPPWSQKTGSIVSGTQLNNKEIPTEPDRDSSQMPQQ